MSGSIDNSVEGIEENIKNEDTEYINKLREEKNLEYIRNKKKRGYKNREYLGYGSAFFYTSDEVINNNMSKRHSTLRGDLHTWGEKTPYNIVPYFIRDLMEDYNQEDVVVHITYEANPDIPMLGVTESYVEYLIIDIRTNNYKKLYMVPDTYIKKMGKLNIKGTVRNVNDILINKGIAKEYLVEEIDLKFKERDFTSEENLLHEYLITGYFSKYHSTLDSVYEDYKSRRGVIPPKWEKNALRVFKKASNDISKIKEYYSKKSVGIKKKNAFQNKYYNKETRRGSKLVLNEIKKYDIRELSNIEESGEYSELDKVQLYTKKEEYVDWD